MLVFKSKLDLVFNKYIFKIFSPEALHHTKNKTKTQLHLKLHNQSSERGNSYYYFPALNQILATIRTSSPCS